MDITWPQLRQPGLFDNFFFYINCLACTQIVEWFFTSLLFMDTTLPLTSEQVSKWLHCSSFLCHHLEFSLWFPRLIYWSLLFFSFTWSFTGLKFINFEQIDVRRWVKDVASLIISFLGGLATLAMVLQWIAPGICEYWLIGS